MRDAATAKKNGELSTAEKTKKQAEQAVQSALSDAQKNAQATHDQAVQKQKDTNAARLAEAEKAYQEAVNNTPLTGAVKAAVPDASASGEDTIHLVYDSLDHNIPKTLIDGAQGTSDEGVVHNLNKMPMFGKPGWLYYDPTNDDSETIDVHNLTLRQKEIINQYAVNELNALRNWFVNNISKDKQIIWDVKGVSEVSKGNVNQWHVTDETISKLDEINHLRKINNDDNVTHLPRHW